MTDYASLKTIFAKKGVALLDGAIGTQLQEMGVPMDNTSWAASGLRDFWATVQLMHERYIRAGADVITTNTYSSARHNLEPLGQGDLTGELNRRAVLLARQARDHAAGGRKIWIAGAISGFGIVTGGESYRSLHRYSAPRSKITEEQAQANLNEQAALLAEAGVDFLLIEGTGENTHRRWMIEACRRTGLPFWVGFRCRLDKDSKDVRIGYGSTKSFAQALDEVLADDIQGINVFHTSIGTVEPALDVLKKKWEGLIGVYPEADRSDYTLAYHDHSQKNAIQPDEYVPIAKKWVASGVQMIGGCCGIGVPYIERLAKELPRRVS
jgi:S-methylmethionine-dependent homocysteine/selenocysteine methylase